MTRKVFRLKAQISSNDTQSVLQVIKDFIGRDGKVVVKGEVIEIDAVLEGESAKELNRILLSGMRKKEKKTRLRAEWTSNGSTERFFDYVLKEKKSD